MQRPLVRLHPANRPGRGVHYGRAILLGIDGDVAIVKPLGRHRQIERIPLEFVKGWQSRDVAGVGHKRIAEAIANRQATTTKPEDSRKDSQMAPQLKNAESQALVETLQADVGQAAPKAVTPLSLADEIALFREHKNSLTSRIQSRIDYLNEAKDYLKLELTKVETELAELRSDFEAAAVSVLPLTITPQCESSLAEQGTMRYQSQQILSFLKAHAGISFDATTIKHRLPGLTYQVSMLVKSYVDSGQIVKHGEHRGCAYSYPEHR